MHGFSCGVVLLTVLYPAVADVVDPSPPNAQRPVDYLAWVNTAYGKGITENAADAYHDAFRAYVPSSEAAEIVARDPQASWMGDDLLVLQDWVNRNERFLAKFGRASRTARCYFPRESESGRLTETKPPPAAPFQNAGRLLATRAELRLTAGDTAGALADVATMLRSARHLAAQPSLHEYVVSAGVCALAYDVLIDLPRKAPADVDYDAVLETVRAIDHVAAIPPTAQLRFEKVVLWELAQRFLRDRDGDGRFERLELSGTAAGPLSPPRTMEKITREVEEAFQKLQRLFARDYAEARVAAGAAKTEFGNHGNPLIKASLPSCCDAACVWRKTVAHRNASRVILDMHAYRADQLEWPRELADATRGESPTVRQDPFSGKELGYRLENGEPLVYSVGPDGKDDGGKAASAEGGQTGQGDYVYWPTAIKSGS